MASTPMIEKDLYDVVCSALTEHQRGMWKFAFGLVAGEEVTLFGKRVQAVWPDGLPFDQEWAREKLAELRREPPDLDRKA